MWRLPLIIVLGIVIRLAVLHVHGFPADVYAFTTWMFAMIRVGPHALYTDVSNVSFPAVDYPPGYLYVEWILGLVDRFVLRGTTDERITRLLIKIPAVCADFGVAYVAARIARRLFGPGFEIRTWAILLLAPMLWVVSAIWSQVDSVSSLAFLLTIALAIERRFLLMWIVFAIAVLLKPQPVVIAPLLFLYQAVVDRRRIGLILGPPAAVLTAYVLALPFAPTMRFDQTLRWLLERYTFGIGKYPNNSSGAFNVYTITQPFYRPDAQHVLGLSERTLGTMVFAVLAAAICARALFAWMRDHDPGMPERTLVFSAFLMEFTLFVFTTRMHERYLMPAIVLTPFLMYRSRWSAVAASLLGAIFTINCIFILHGFHGGEHHPITLKIGHALSLIVVMIYAYYAVPWLSGRKNVLVPQERSQTSVV